MNVYEVGLGVRLKEFGNKRPIMKELTICVLEKGSAEAAIRKAKKWAMKKNGWDMGYPLSVKMRSVFRKCWIDVI